MLLAVPLLFAACADPDGADTGADDTATVPEGPCPPGMAQVDALCIDAFETTLTDGVPEPVQGAVPTTFVTWYEAVDACAAAGKHLCTVAEWQAACGDPLPWGAEPPADEVCAVPAPDGTTAWSELQPAGSLPDCRSPAGVYDQIGNAWEWADPSAVDDDGVPITAKLGGAFYAGQGSAYCAAEPNTEHPPDFDGTIAVRCCSEARK